jgi:uncharacterized protein (DUF433 family)
VSDIFAGRDPRDLPRYLVADAARILDLPRATVHAWVVGRALPGRADLVPIIQAAAPKSLSFTNLIEVHVLRAMRKEHKVSMASVRDALATLQKQFPGPHPLATRAFLTDGNDLFVEELGRLVKLSSSEQLGLHEQLKLHLKRIECDEQGLARRLYPFMGEARNVIIDPRVSFGRPVLAGTGVPIDNLVERLNAGDTVEDLADDYGLTPDVVRDAIRVAVQDAA